MSFASRFEELEIWQAAQDLAVEVYSSLGVDTGAAKDFAFVNQIRSAAVSISNNIAEGFECASSKELQRFLTISKRSCGEVRSMLWLAPRLKYLAKSGALADALAKAQGGAKAAA